jgi:uncharacterized UBP type Zn finger protein
MAPKHPLSHNSNPHHLHLHQRRFAERKTSQSDTDSRHVSHKGPSVHSGHYVAHIRKGDDWILFNDEKVVKADAESVKTLKKLVYLYVFEMT